MTDDDEEKAFDGWFKSVVESSCLQAKSAVAGERKIPPTLLVFGENEGEVAVLPVPMANPQEKRLSFLAIRTLAQQDEVVGVVFMTEAWIVVGNRVLGESIDQQFDKLRNQDLEAHPDRQEVVLWTGMRRDLQTMARAKITRDRGISTLGVVEYIDIKGAIGDLIVRKKK